MSHFSDEIFLYRFYSWQSFNLFEYEVNNQKGFAIKRCLFYITAFKNVDIF